MKILLARHGETAWNAEGRIQGHTDMPLNEGGRAQAEEMGRLLAASGEHITALYASPLKRAFETAQIAGKALGLEPVAVPELEEVSFGIWEGLTWTEVAEKWPELRAAFRRDHYHCGAPEGESYGQALERVLPALERLKNAGEGTALVVCHGAVMMAVLSHRDGMPFDEHMSSRYTMHNCQWVEL